MIPNRTGFSYADALVGQFRNLGLNEGSDATLARVSEVPDPIGLSRYVRRVTHVHQDDIHALIPLGSQSIASGSKDATIAVWSKNLECLARMSPDNHAKGYKHWITALMPIPQKEMFLAGTRSGLVTLWSSRNHARLAFRYPDAIGDNAAPICKSRNRIRINCFGEIPGREGMAFLTGLPTILQTWTRNKLDACSSCTVSENDWLYCIKPLDAEKYALVIGSDVEVWEQIPDEGTFSRLNTLYREVKEEIVGKQRPHISSVEHLQTHQLAMALFSGHTKVLDLNSGQITACFKEHQGRVWTVTVLSPHTFATGADDRQLKIWDVRQQRSVAASSAHPGRVSCILLLGEQQLLAASCPDDPYQSKEKGTFTLWDLRQ